MWGIKRNRTGVAPECVSPKTDGDNDSSTACVCEAGYETGTGGACIQCVAPLTDDDSNSSTVCVVTEATCTTAGTGLVPAGDKLSCVCDVGYQTESNGSCTECVAPLTDDDSDSSNLCKVTDDTCEAAYSNSQAASDGLSCECDSGYRDANGGSGTPDCREIVTGLLPAGIPAEGELADADFQTHCAAFGLTWFNPAGTNPSTNFCHDGATFASSAVSAGQGDLTKMRDCALQRKLGTGKRPNFACGAQCSDGEVVRGNACVSGDYNQCDERPGPCPVWQTCTDTSHSTTEAAAALCTGPVNRPCDNGGESSGGGTTCDCSVAVGFSGDNCEVLSAAATNCNSAGYSFVYDAAEGGGYCDFGGAARIVDFQDSANSDDRCYFYIDGVVPADRAGILCDDHFGAEQFPATALPAVVSFNCPENSEVDGTTYSCVCSASHPEGSPPDCYAERTLTVDAADNGIVSARSLRGTEVGEGESANIRTTETAVATATPDAGYYVSEWTGDCAADGLNAPTGEGAQTCDLPAGDAAAEVGAVFLAHPRLSVDASDPDGVLVARTSAGTEVAEGASAQIRTDESVVFTATPDSRLHVLLRWTGACGADGVNPEIVDRGRGAQTCEVPAGRADVQVGAVFGDLPCPPNSRVINSADPTRCVCNNGYYDRVGVDGDYETLECVTRRIRLADISLTGGGRCAKGAFDNAEQVDPFIGNFGIPCHFGNFTVNSRDCYIVRDGQVPVAGKAIRSDSRFVEYIGGPSVVSELGNYPDRLCDVVYPACNAEAGQTPVDGNNPFSGCTVSAQQCSATDPNSVPNSNRSACVCDSSRNYEGEWGECEVRRAVSVSGVDAAEGAVLLTVRLTSAAAGETARVGVLVSVTLVATPAAGYYVSRWTGACGSGADPAPVSAATGEGDAGEDIGTAKECVVAPGSGDIAAGAEFGEVAQCGDEFREQTDATTCGECLSSHVADDGNICQKRLTCADDNRKQTNPYTCGGCLDTHYDADNDAQVYDCQPLAVCTGANQVASRDVCVCEDGYFDPDGVDSDGGGLNCVRKRITVADVNTYCITTPGFTSDYYDSNTPLSDRNSDTAVVRGCSFFNPQVKEICVVVYDGKVVRSGTDTLETRQRRVFL